MSGANASAAREGPVLAAYGLVLKAYPRAEPFDFEVGAGEHWLLVGDEGSGKTGLAKTLIGLLSPAAGSLSLLGVSLGTLAPRGLLALRRRIGVVFEKDGLIPAWTGFDNLALPLRLAGERDDAALVARIDGFAQRYELPAAWLDASCATLTREQRGALAFARALIGEPELLLVDGQPIELVLGYAGDVGPRMLADYLAGGGTLLVCVAEAFRDQVPETAIGARFRQASIAGGRLQFGGAAGPTVAAAGEP